jgi:dienelactone hydrolase
MRPNEQAPPPAGERPFTRRALAALALATLLAGPALADAPVKKTFPSGGKAITVEHFEPAKQGKYPAVVFLYGIDGLHEGNQGQFRLAARTLAGEGYVVLIVHYHNRTDTGQKDIPALQKQFQDFLRRRCKGSPEQKALRAMYADWTGTVKDAVKYARALPGVEPGRVCLVGFSLGGFLAASLASEPEQNIAAVVSLFGGIPRDRGASLRHFPPALIITGDEDTVVPFTESLYLFVRLKDQDRPCSLKIYEGVGHGFLTKEGKPAVLSLLDAQGRVARFLGEHLARKAGPLPAKVTVSEK